MMHFVNHLLQQYGYPVITIGVAIECAGLLFPGETIFFGSAVYASTTGKLSIVAIVLAAIAGAIIGNFIGFAIGRLIGARVLARHGGRIGLTERRLALGRYLFRRHGGKVVFFSRFVSVLRSFNALLAGASDMPVRNFVLWTIIGGVVWPMAHGSFAYALGNTAKRVSGPVQVALGLAVVLGVIVILRFVKKNETRLEELAMQENSHHHV